MQEHKGPVRKLVHRPEHMELVHTLVRKQVHKVLVRDNHCFRRIHLDTYELEVERASRRGIAYGDERVHHNLEQEHMREQVPNNERRQHSLLRHMPF
jgi:hypothetical protein